MTTRLLLPHEWPRLAGTLLDTIWPTLDPRWADVFVVERNGQIEATALLMPILHVECVSSSGVAAGRALWRALIVQARARGVRSVWGAAVDAPMQRLLTRHAVSVPGSHFLMPIQESSRCLQS